MTATAKRRHDLGEVWFDLTTSTWRADTFDDGEVVSLTGRTRRQLERELGGTDAARRFPYDRLIQRSGMSRSALRMKVGISGESARRYESEGLTVWQADRLAVRLGFHPANVWPDWWGTAPASLRRGDAA